MPICHIETKRLGTPTKELDIIVERVRRSLRTPKSAPMHIAGNVVPCCETCNKFKLDMPLDKFIDKCRQIANYSDILHAEDKDEKEDQVEDPSNQK